MPTPHGHRTSGRGPARDAATRREEILATATRLFAEHGYSDAMTQELADRLGIGKGTIYRHFPSKRDLLLAAAERVMKAAAAQIDASVAGLEDGVERLAKAILAFLTFFAENPEGVEVLIQERAQWARFKDRSLPTYIEHRTERGLKWRKLYEEMTAVGRFRAIDPARIGEVIENLAYGTMFTNHFMGRTRPVAEQARDIVEIVLHGIASEDERARLHELPSPHAVDALAAGPST